jgi:hypothetical protein
LCGPATTPLLSILLLQVRPKKPRTSSAPGTQANLLSIFPQLTGL